MKKFFSIFVAVALVAVSFSSCKEKNKPEPVENPKLTIAVSEIEPAAALISVTPENDTLPYYWTYFEAEELEGYTDKQIIDTFLLGEMEFAAWYLDLENYEELLSVGADEYKYEGLSPMTDYVALATYVDAEGNVTYGDLFKKEFKTPDVEMVDLTFTFERTGNDAILVTPSDDVNPWDYYATTAEELAEFDNDTTALVEAVIDYYGSDYAASGAYEFSISEELVSEAGDYTLLVFGNVGALNSAIAHYDFTWDGVAAEGGEAPARKVQTKKAIVKRSAFHKSAKELRLRK